MKYLNIGLSHPKIKQLKELKRKTNENVVIEDISILDFLYKDHKKLETLIYCPSLVIKEQTKQLLDNLIKISKEVYEVSSKVYLSIVEKENSVGIIGIYKDKTLSIKDLNAKKHQFVAVLDKLENPGNIGTIFRTCDGCGVDLVILVDEVCKANSFKVVQASRGMSLFVDKISLSYQEAINFLLENDYDIYLGEPELGKDYQSYSYQNKCAIVIGNERFGINKDWYNKPHKEVYIPMAGKMPCYNVAVAGSCLLLEAFMKRNRKN